MKGTVKVYEILDGKEALVYQGDNMLTFGFKNQIISLLSDDIVANAGDYYKINYFQIGDGLIGSGTSSTSSNVYTLSSPFDILDYGDGASFPTVALHNLEFSSGNLGAIPSGGFDGIKISAGESLFAPINRHNRTKVYAASLDYRIKLSKSDCANQTIKEVALYLKNPHNHTNDVPMMAAYKTFSSGIYKSDKSELIIDWSIMLYDVRVIDTTYTDAYPPHVDSIGFSNIHAQPALDPCEAAATSNGGWLCLGGYAIPGHIQGALTIPIGGYLGPAGGGTPPSYLVPNQTYCFWAPNYTTGLAPAYAGEVRFNWRYEGYGYWIYLGYNTNVPFQGPAGGGSF